MESMLTTLCLCISEFRVWDQKWAFTRSQTLYLPTASNILNFISSRVILPSSECVLILWWAKLYLRRRAIIWPSTDHLQIWLTKTWLTMPKWQAIYRLVSPQKSLLTIAKAPLKSSWILICHSSCKICRMGMQHILWSLIKEHRCLTKIYKQSVIFSNLNQKVPISKQFSKINRSLSMPIKILWLTLL